MSEEGGRHREGTGHQPRLIVHLVYRLCEGGLENGLINIVARTPSCRFRHLVVALDRVSDFAERLPDRERQAVALHCLNRRHASRHLEVLRLLRRLRPAILHTRNLPTMEFQLTGLLAGVRVRIHSEHGRDLTDDYGRSRKYRALRRAVDPAVTAYVTVNQELAVWLQQDIGVDPRRVRVIHNGVDSARFRPSGPAEDERALLPCGLRRRIIIGTVGRMAEVKDHITLVKAFLRLRAQCPAMERNVGLVIVGDGVNRSQCLSLLEASGAAQAAWLPGTRLDIERVYRAFDVFVLSSWAEGMPNTILEAMATGLPVVSTDVGAARELIVEGTTGLLVPPRDTDALASSLAELLADETRWRLMGKAGRTRVIQRFSLETMVDRYLDFYACSLAR